MMVFREVIAWLYKLASKYTFDYEMDRNQKIVINFDAILGFLFVQGKKLKSISYMKLLKNWQHNRMTTSIQSTTTTFPHVQDCPSPTEPEIENSTDPKTNDDGDSRELVCELSLHQHFIILQNSTEDTVDFFKDNKTNLIESFENIPTSIIKPRESSSVIMRLAKQSTSDDYAEDCTEDISDDDDDDDDESSNCSSDDDDANNISSSHHHMLSSEISLEEAINDEENESDEEISDDDDIVFCAEDEQNFATKNNLSKRVRFKSQAEFHDVDSKWSDDDLMEARLGPWEECARDRMRFRRRIEETAKQFAWIFTDSHRDKTLAYIRNYDNVG